MLSTRLALISVINLWCAIATKLISEFFAHDIFFEWFKLIALKPHGVAAWYVIKLHLVHTLAYNIACLQLRHFKNSCQGSFFVSLCGQTSDKTYCHNWVKTEKVMLSVKVSSSYACLVKCLFLMNSVKPYQGSVTGHQSVASALHQHVPKKWVNWVEELLVTVADIYLRYLWASLNQTST